ncbi:MAG: amidohydrolase family protein [Oscillospiraceae bacterium]|jgi:predicted TIM-barrel fold metal-dependent hydrolase|nr:amidohydrolase family protein [Oscillospiraceae bacterium]
MTIIDTHAHIFPPKVERVATDAIGTFYDHGMAHSGSIEQLLDSGARAGVTRFVVFSTATTPQQVTRINDFILDACATHPEFVGAGTMHPEFADFKAELDRIHDAGIRGIKLHPDFQKFFIDCDALLSVFEYLQEKHMFLITHSGDIRHHFSDPVRVARVAKLFPKMNVVAAHFGGWSEWDVGRRELAHLPNVYVDTSSTFGFGGNEQVIEGFRAFDNSHIFFGDDFPMWEHADEIANLRGLGLDDTTLENVLGGNFERFLELYEGETP